MITFGIAEDDSLPLYRQIAGGIRRSVAEGGLSPGDRLPSGRELAIVLGVNLETAQRAYRLLAEEGVVVSHVGRGTRIAPDASVERTNLDATIDALVREALQLAVPLDTLTGRIRTRYGDLTS